jgi:hypothetical protein
MIEQFLNDAAAVQRMRASPVGSQLDSFAARLTQLGYARASIRDRLWTLSTLGRWLRRRHLEMGDLRADVTDAFLKRHSPARRVGRSDQATLRLFLEHLEATGIIPAPPSPTLSPILQLKAQYEAYLRHDRGLSPVTGSRHWFILRRWPRLSVAIDHAAPRDASLCVRAPRIGAWDTRVRSARSSAWR